MVKNKALPDSARPCKHPCLVTLSLSLSLSLPRRLGPMKAGLTCLLSLSRQRHSSWGYPLDPAKAGPRHLPYLIALFCRIKFKFLLLGNKTSMSSFCLSIFPKDLSSPFYLHKDSSQIDYLKFPRMPRSSLRHCAHLSLCKIPKIYKMVFSNPEILFTDFDGSYLPFKTPTDLVPRAVFVDCPWLGL